MKRVVFEWNCVCVGGGGGCECVNCVWGEKNPPTHPHFPPGQN